MRQEIEENLEAETVVCNNPDTMVPKKILKNLIHNKLSKLATKHT